MRSLLAPADGAHARNESKPVCEEDEDENRGKKPKRLLHKVGAEDAAKKVIETLDQPLPEILRAIGDRFHFASGELGEDDDADSDDPGHEHGIGDGKTTD